MDELHTKLLPCYCQQVREPSWPIEAFPKSIRPGSISKDSKLIQDLTFGDAIVIQLVEWRHIVDATPKSLHATCWIRCYVVGSLLQRVHMWSMSPIVHFFLTCWHTHTHSLLRHVWANTHSLLRHVSSSSMCTDGCWSKVFLLGTAVLSPQKITSAKLSLFPPKIACGPMLDYMWEFLVRFMSLTRDIWVSERPWKNILWRSTFTCGVLLFTLVLAHLLRPVLALPHRN